ncbi:hypothetical protein, partial [Actinoplanes philippinensis]|uniref:hypothetical protein n=1 Tax=Actinoplanes philippinensis TaxID=35752 RepID=UPI0033F5152E
GGGAGVAPGRAPAAPPELPAATAEPAPTVVPVATPPAQALILDDAAGLYRVPGGAEVAIDRDRQAGELRPDGVLVGHPVVGAPNWTKVVPLPDGGIVAFSSYDTKSAVDRSGRPDVAGLEYRLVVTGPDGRARIQRDIRRRNEQVTLLTADATTAYLWRPSGLFAHDLATGTERAVVKEPMINLGKVFGGLRHSDLSAGRLAMASTDDECLPLVVDVATGRPVSRIPLGRSDCFALNRMRLSPDGTMLAVAYQYKSTSKTPPAAVALIRVSDGAVVARRDRIGMVDGVSLAVSLAWQDDRTLRGAEYPVAAGGVSEVNGFTLTAR